MNTSAARTRTGGFGSVVNSANSWGNLSRIHQSLVKWAHEGLPNTDEHADWSQLQDVARNPLDPLQDRISDQICVVSGKNEVFYVTNGTAIMNFALVDQNDPAAGIQVMGTVDVARDLDKRERESGLLLHPTYDGHLAVVSAHSIRIVDNGLNRTLSVLRFPEELFTRNVTVDDCGGIYIVSDSTLRKVIWTGSRLTPFETDGAWSSPYDHGDKQTSSGATAPVLMGTANDPDKLVVIADAADRRKLVAFWRDRIPSGWNKLPDAVSRRIVGQIPIACEPISVPDGTQSVAVHDYGAFVLSNAKAVTAYQNPGCSAHNGGVERFEWNPATRRWASVWTRHDVACKGVVPTVDGPLGVVFLNTYANGAGYPVMGMDWLTGETVR